MKSKLEELIEKFCPNGVEYRELGEICNIRNGYTPKKNEKKFWDNGAIPWFKLEDIRLNGNVLKDSIQKVTKDAIKNELFEKDSIIISTTATIGVLAIIEVPFICNQQLTVLTPKQKLIIKYLYYYLSNEEEQLLNLANSSGGIKIISNSNLKQVKIALPPLEIQEEIVRILDKFTELTTELITELTTELTLRKQQYKHYRDELLNKAKNIKIVTLDMISENYDSQRKPITSGNREKGNIPYYGASGIVDYINDYIFDGDYLLISEDGANLLTRVTPIAFSISGKTWVNNHAHVLKFSENITRKYVEIYLNSIDLKIYITGAAQPKLNQKNLNSIKIPLPPLEEQKRIVEILDRFDKIINDIKDKLPAEIEMRQKQYEYYRDKLLNFKKLNVEG